MASSVIMYMKRKFTIRVIINIILHFISGARRESQGVGGERSEGGEDAARGEQDIIGGDGDVRGRPDAHVVRAALREEPSGAYSRIFFKNGGKFKFET